MMKRLEAAARQALARLQAHTDTADLDAIAALNEALAEQQAAELVTLETVYETIIKWDEGGGKRSRRELARRIVALYAAPTQQPVLVRDLAEILGVTVTEVCHELEECGGPRRSTNMAVSGVEALAVAAQLKQAAKPVAMRYRFHYPDDGSKPYRTSEWKYTQGPWDKIPGNARDVSALSLHEAPTQQPLTDEQIDRIADQHPAYLGSVYPHAFARAIEAAHGITGSKT